MAELTVVKSEPLRVVSSAPLGAPPAEGQWINARTDENILQSELTPSRTKRIESEAGWQWHPPGVKPGQDATAGRADSAVVGGIPIYGDITPEGLLIGGQLVRGTAAAVQRVSGALPKVMAALGSVAPLAGAEVKAHLVKYGLTAIGIPAPLADTVATAVVFQGGRRAGAAETAAAETSIADKIAAERVPGGRLAGISTKEDAARRAAAQAAEAASRRAVGMPASPDVTPAGAAMPTPPPALTPLADLAAGRGASVPAAPAPGAVPALPLSAPTPPPLSAAPTAGAPAAAAGWSPQRLANELGLAARRAKVTLTEAQYAQAADRVRAGSTPAEAVTAAAPPAAPAKLKITAAESGTYSALRRQGLSDTEIRAAIQAQRDLAARLGTPTSEAVRQAVDQRNLTGRWPD